MMRMNSLFNKQAGKVLKSKSAAVSLARTGKADGQLSFECKFFMIQVNLKYGMLFI